MIDQVEGPKGYISTFFRKSFNGILFSPDERNDGDYFDPAFTEIDRILEVIYDGKRPTTARDEDNCKPEDFGIKPNSESKFEPGTGRQFLIKWKGLPYAEKTLEWESDLLINDVEYKDDLKSLYVRCKKPKSSEMARLTNLAEEERRRAYKIFGDKSKTADDERQREVQSYQRKLEQHIFKNGGQLRDYQAEGVAWMLSNYVNNRSCILADGRF